MAQMLGNSQSATTSSFSKRRDRFTTSNRPTTFFQRITEQIHCPAVQHYAKKTMTTIGRRISNCKKATSFLIMVVCMVTSLRCGTVQAFLSRPQRSTLSILIAQIGNSDADRTFALMATDEDTIISVTDSNYRELFRGEKPLLIDAYAVW